VLILAIALAVVAVTSAVQGAVGYGMNLLAVPALVLLDPSLVPGPALVLGLVLSLAVAVRERAPLDLRLGWAVVGLLPGCAAALLLLASVHGEALTAPLGALVLIGVALSAVRLRLSPTLGTLVVAGAASGFLATAASIGGPPIALVYADASGARVRRNLSAFFVVAAAVSLLALAASGHFGAHELRPSLLLLPGVVLGFLASARLRHLVDRGHTRVAILWLSALAGFGALAQGLLG
jgi:uncharacterized membrane protein YfcA